MLISCAKCLYGEKELEFEKLYQQIIIIEIVVKEFTKGKYVRQKSRDPNRGCLGKYIVTRVKSCKDKWIISSDKLCRQVSENEN